jgi:ubiquinone biosynthesis protein
VKPHVTGPWLDLVRDGMALWRFSRLGAWIGLRWLLRSPPAAAEIGVRLRDILERMGITYVKLGQFLAIRFDLVHPDIARELSALFDAVPPAAPSAIRRVIEEEFGRPTEALFADFDWTCVAAASIAEVHRARLHTGDVVAVKVQRPLVRELFAADIRFFRTAGWIVDHVRPVGAISLMEALDQFERYTVREMDFLAEAETSDQLRKTAGPFETAPRPYWEFTRERVLTMEFEQGAPLSEIIRLSEQGRHGDLKRLLPRTDLALVVRHIANASFRQIFIQGFFHADPHPGNIFVRADGTIVFVDFGISGRLTPWELDTLTQFVAAAAVGNVRASLHYFSKLLLPTDQTDIGRMQRDLASVIFRWLAAVSDVRTSPEERHFGRYVNEFLSEARRHGTGISLEALLFWRALITLNGTVLRLDPRSDVLNLLAAFFASRQWTMLWRRFSGAGTALAVADGLRAATAHGLALPPRTELRPDQGSRRGLDAEAKWAAAGIVIAMLLLLTVLYLVFPRQPSGRDVIDDHAALATPYLRTGSDESPILRPTVREPRTRGKHEGGH